MHGNICSSFGEWQERHICIFFHCFACAYILLQYWMIKLDSWWGDKDTVSIFYPCLLRKERGIENSEMHCLSGRRWGPLSNQPYITFIVIQLHQQVVNYVVLELFDLPANTASCKTNVLWVEGWNMLILNLYICFLTCQYQCEDCSVFISCRQNSTNTSRHGW